MPATKNTLALLCVLSCMLAQTQANLTQIPGQNLKQVSASDNYVWGVNSYNHIYRCHKPCTGENWEQIPGTLNQLDIDNNEVWGVTTTHTIFKRPIELGAGDDLWIPIPGLLKQVSASGSGYIWGVTTTDNIFKCRKPCNGEWELVDGLLKQVDAGPICVYGVNSWDNIFARPVDGSGSWRHIPGSLKEVTWAGDYLYGVNAGNEVLRCALPCYHGNWEKVPGELHQCDGCNEALYGVDAYGAIFRNLATI